VTIERTIGGPGTGKTREILRCLSEAKDEMRLSPEEIAMCTFSVAGRVEISERAAQQWGVSVESLTRDGWFRTAHSIAYRQCGIDGEQILAGDSGEEWLSEAMGCKVRKSEDIRGERRYLAAADETNISEAIEAWDVARNRCEPLRRTVERMNLENPKSRLTAESAAAVVDKYETAKRRADKLDYVDLISMFAGIRHSVGGPEEVTPQGDVPESIRVLAIDEAQDSSRLVDAVCRRLANGPNVERVWITGDPYQSCHGFAGGDYRLFLSWDVDSEKTMPRSYRCPPQVMALGEQCLRQMRSGYRDRKILPAEHGGRVARYASIEPAIAGIESLGSVLILARCAASLWRYTSELDSRSIPWQWADSIKSEVEMSGYECLWDLSRGKMVSNAAWSAAISLLSVSDKEHGVLLRRGEKTAWGRGDRSQIDVLRPCSDDMDLAGVCEPLWKLIAAGDWHLAVEPRKRARAQKWLRAAAVSGPAAASNPQVRVSTIHSAKGLEADTVLISSRTSAAVERGRMFSDERHDEEWRVAYIGVTRARRELRYIDEGGSESMQIPA
jgi:DNA helicase-2/ATP-dependent DNA helicase PcrA